MEFDFSALEQSFNQQTSDINTKEAEHNKFEERQKDTLSFRYMEEQTARLQKRQQEEQQTVKTAAIYKQYQNNIMNSETLRSELMKGVHAGESSITLLLKAVKCISLMIGDSTFYNGIAKDIKSVYGIGLEASDALDLEREELQNRLNKLQKALHTAELDQNDADRIQIAINENLNRLKFVESIVKTDIDQM